MTTYKLMGYTITLGESFEKEVNRFGVTRMESAQWWDIFDPQGIKLDTNIINPTRGKRICQKTKGGQLMVNAKLHIICGNCGSLNDFNYKIYLSECECDATGLRLTCNNCATLHIINESEKGGQLMK